ncbi:MAG TPA: chemotaxis response regulator protein-glutamate methylesterase [Acidocella sp.]|uniref:protein-glutamate methylesterase/protein-glutamine glutaminase n=1 Tax=Acidocella sp. TaxID=50710 RepID=UPI002B742358|nr:chemotaxis response regulator protein-glutamate methylesterase [Acidocella sp.]HVE20829.1 chemotaxis response regulator protein-glutamate methylesterase [Acidocella sp.]
MTRPVRLLIVDDSETMCRFIASVVQTDRDVEVVGIAGDPNEARQAIKQLNPDVITLDIEMPHMNGLEFLEKIMRLRPTPVIMVSSLTQEGAEVSLRALEIGAVDCVAKPSVANMHSLDSLADLVKAAANARHVIRRNTLADSGEPEEYAPDGRIIGIGASTGGVEALIRIISEFPKNCPPTVISQHMPATFTKSFAQRLNKLSQAEVTEAVDGAPLVSGHVYLAPGNHHLEVTKSAVPRCRLSDADRVNGHRPSVDVMFKSLAHNAGERAIGVILTGMGRDGAEGLLGLRRTGAMTLGQDESSSVVYGMPKVAFEIGAVTRQYPLDQIAMRLLQMSNAKRKDHA